MQQTHIARFESRGAFGFQDVDFLGLQRRACPSAHSTAISPGITAAEAVLDAFHDVASCRLHSDCFSRIKQDWIWAIR